MFLRDGGFIFIGMGAIGIILERSTVFPVIGSRTFGQHLLHCGYVQESMATLGGQPFIGIPVERLELFESFISQQKIATFRE